MKRIAPVFCLFTFAFCLFLSSCKKDSFITSEFAQVRITSDTLKYDTVFTTTGSITKSFKIINENSQKLRLSKVKLMGGAASAYKMNVDGAATNEVTNLDIEANDSIYVFVSVTINPNAANLPFIVSDSILINYNGNNRYVQLQSYGQNANFLRNRLITGNVVWTNNLPYVILGSILIDTTASLTIQPGCRIYSHADAPFIVDGTLIVNGTKANPIAFAGDRLDEGYKDLPASWPGIYFRETSVNNTLQFAVIKNAYQGIVAESPSQNAAPKVVLNQCVIDNSYDAGILGAQSSIQASNCLVSNCGKNIVLGYGGSYAFTHCTAASFSNDLIAHVSPVLSVSNYVLQGNALVTSDLTANFVNCIFWGNNGNVEDEVVVSRQGSTAFTVNLSNCLWKVKNSPADVSAVTIISNSDPLFDSVNTSRRYYDFHLKAGSPAINKGIPTALTQDLDGNTRAVGLPDLGCYERQ
ncbi:MAG: choice-of-anchor Q domain-containing protein [Bacteroidota bacterium]